MADAPPPDLGAAARAARPPDDVAAVVQAAAEALGGPVVVFARSATGQPLVAVVPVAEAVHPPPATLDRLDRPGATLLVPSRAEPLASLDPASADLLARTGSSGFIAAAVGSGASVDGAVVVLDAGRARAFAAADLGELSAVAVRLAPALDGARTPLLLAAEARRRHAAEARARGALGLVDVVGASTGAGALAFDAGGRCTMAAGSGVRRVLRHPDPVGRPMLDVLLPDPHVLAGFDATLAGGASSATVELADAVLELRWTPRVLDDGSVVGGVLVVVDASRPVRAVAALRETAREVEAESDQRAEALDRALSAGQAREDVLVSAVHDDVLQLLSAVGWRLDALGGKVEAGAADELRALAGQLREATQRLGRAIDEVVAPAADVVDVAALVEARLDAVPLAGGVARRLVDEVGAPVPPGVAAVLADIAADAVDNVARHASATTVEVTVRSEDGGVAVVVHDDGVGFDPAAGLRRGSRGIHVMRERARTAGGWVRLDARPGRGTTVHAWVPLR